jgi:ribosome-binding factor A
LQSSAGFLQTKVGKRIDTRYTPKLRFELDMGVKKSLAIAQLLSDVLPSDDAPSDSPAHDAAEDASDEDTDDIPAEADN